ncbi:MAG: phospholipid carrier-dependent glycosyltransferase [Thermoguttaceae bacterium]|nr:phospholipid carrier-dependent glycosyltransferase [Thermoguttaceae bacterium]
MKRFWFFLLLAAFLTRLAAAVYWDDRVRNAAFVPGVAPDKTAQIADAPFLLPTAPIVQTADVPFVPSTAQTVQTDDASSVPPTAQVADLPSVPETTQTARFPSADGPFFFGDSDSYWKLGRALAFGRSYRFDEERRWEIFRTPGYPALLAPLFWAFGENPPILAARFLGVCFGTLNVGLVVVLAFAYFRRRSIAAFSGFVVAFDPTLVLQSVLVLSEEPFLTFALLQHLVALDVARRLGLLAFPSVDLPPLKSADSLNSADAQPTQALNSANSPRFFAVDAPPSFARLVLSGVALGVLSAATVYLRPSWLYFLPFATFFAFAFRFSVFFTEKRAQRRAFPFPATARLDVKRRVFPAFLVVAGTTALLFAAALAPWTLRNYRLTGRPIATSLQMGASLYDGWRPDADGASDMRFVDEFRRLELESPSAPPSEHFEVRLDRRLKTAALDWASANPDAVARLAVVKLARLWSPIPREPAFSTPALQTLLAATFAPLLVGGLCGFYRSFRRRGAGWTLLLPSLYLSALHSIFVSSIRYRVPVLYGFALLTAFAVVAFLDDRRGRRDALDDRP